MTEKQDEAYNKFKEAIFSRVFQPGQTLTQAKIKEELGVSLGPLRDALKRLEWEDLIRIFPQSGIQVLIPNFKDLKEAFQLRVILEKEAVRQFTVQKTSTTLEKLEENTRTLAKIASHESAENGFLLNAINVDYSLHYFLIAEMNNEHLSRYFRILFDKIRIAWLTTRYTTEIINPVMNEHIEIFNAIKTGDPKKAAQVMEDHLQQSLRRILGV